MSAELISTLLDEAELARVDQLATLYRVTRAEMIARIFLTGLLAQEQQARQARSLSKKNGGAS